MTCETYQEILDYLKSKTADTPFEGKIFAVGGCCRDAIMHREIADIDLAVELPDGGVRFAEWLFQQGLTVAPPVLFRKYSTGRLHLKAFPQHELETVQTRREKYTDHNSRNPEVCFGSVKEDCFRRDLTINSLYQSVTTGEVLDLTGRGIDDIRNGRIRTPLDPDTTFDDDPLRILRTVRFACRFGWDVPAETMGAMKRNVQRLVIIRKERLAAEFEKLLEGEHPSRGLELLRRLGAISFIVPELCHLYKLPASSGKTVWEETLQRVDASPARLPNRWGALLTDIGKAAPFIRERRRKEEEKGEEKGARKGSSRRSRDSRRGRGRSSIITHILGRLRYKPSLIKSVKSTLPHREL